MTEINRRKICSGVYFQSIPDSRFKTMRIAVHMLMPMSRKTAAQYALIPFLLCRTCKEYPDYTALGRKLASLYGASLNASVQKLGDMQVLSIIASGLSDRYALEKENISEELTKLVCSVIFEPLFENNMFTEENFKQEQRQTLELIDSEFNDKRLYAQHKCQQIMFADEPAGISRFGSRDDVKNLQCQDLTEAWHQIISKSYFEITVSGDCNPDAIYSTFSQAFEKERFPITVQNSIIPTASNVHRKTEQTDVAQAKLIMGFRTATSTDNINDIQACRLMTVLFGGTATSKLFMNVREKLSLCYYCSAQFDPNKGVIWVESGVEQENLEKAEKEILVQLDEIRRGNFTDEEIEAAKFSLYNVLETVGDYLGAIDHWYLTQLFRPDIYTPEQSVEQISSVTREQIIDAAKKVTLDTVFQLVGNSKEEATE